ncbi:PKD domain-containing protein [Planctomycetota bacterium]
MSILSNSRRSRKTVYLQVLCMFILIGVSNMLEANTPPEATASADLKWGPKPLDVTLTGSGTDPDGDTLSYSWNFGDGQTSAQQNPVHTFVYTGTYICVLTVTDGKGGADTASVTVEVLRETYGAAANPTGDPIGGGKGYRRIIASSEATVVVSTKAEILNALASAAAGDIVFVDNSAEIDLTNERSIIIPAGVTLASDRGLAGSNGGLVYTTEDKWTGGVSERFELFTTGGDNVRVTGLRLRGPDAARRNRYDYINSDGIYTTHDYLEVDNCELHAWSHGGVFLRTGKYARVHHCSIHHCQRNGLGYGVVLDKAEVRVEANIFDWNRHSIAGTGRSPSGYEACYNLIRPNAQSHYFDMHGGADRGDGTNIAGDWIDIRHNTFVGSNQRAFVLRGVPTQYCHVHHNRFKHTSQSAAILQINATGNLSVFSNIYSSTYPGYYTITAEAGIGGTVFPRDSITVPNGDSQIYAVAPDAGYAVDDVLVDGASEGAVSDYTFSTVSASHTIEAQFMCTNDPPQSVINADPASGKVPLDVNFDGSSSTDSDGTIAGYSWDFGDGSPLSNIMQVTHTYTSEGTFTASLTVTDNEGVSDTAQVTITVDKEKEEEEDKNKEEFERDPRIGCNCSKNGDSDPASGIILITLTLLSITGIYKGGNS